MWGSWYRYYPICQESPKIYKKPGYLSKDRGKSFWPIKISKLYKEMENITEGTLLRNLVIKVVDNKSYLHDKQYFTGMSKAVAEFLHSHGFGTIKLYDYRYKRKMSTISTIKIPFKKLYN